MLGPVEAVADDEAILDGEAEVVDRHLDLGARRLVEERADLDARRMARAEELEQVRDGEAGVDDVLDEEDVLALDGRERSWVIWTTPLELVPSP